MTDRSPIVKKLPKARNIEDSATGALGVSELSCPVLALEFLPELEEFLIAKAKEA